MAKQVIEHSAHISAPPAQVWQTIADTRRYPEWVMNTLEVVTASSEVADAGVTYTERNRIAGPLTGGSSWRVTSCDPPRHAVHDGDGIWIAKSMRLEMTVEPDGQGTAYTHRFSYEPALGPLGPLVNLGLRPSLSGDMRRTVERLKVLCEAEAEGS
jgi:uncharacterized protein YndB with AHSA1/START domain